MQDKKKTRGAVPVLPTAIPGQVAQQTTGVSRRYVETPQYCRECGGRLVRIGYCFTCMACGWGGCS
ncbi:MAG: hypothetical protein R3F48_07055 [Candidatus Zixiibacteriota bacterium]